MRSLVALEPVEEVGVDVAATKREREDAPERAENPLDRPGRETVSLQFARDRDDIVRCDHAVRQRRDDLAVAECNDSAPRSPSASGGATKSCSERFAQYPVRPILMPAKRLGALPSLAC
jgi:hypothetical protein